MNTLDKVGLKEEVVIKDFDNDSPCVKRLLSLGIEPGTIVRREYKTLFRGTICISNKYRMIAIDHYESAKIHVTPHPQAIQI